MGSEMCIRDRLIPDSGFAISIFSLAIMISGLAIMKLVLAQGIF